MSAAIANFCILIQLCRYIVTNNAMQLSAKYHFVTDNLDPNAYRPEKLSIEYETKIGPIDQN